MKSDVAIVRQKLEDLPFVHASWFEWERRAGESMKRVLVVEIDIDTDPIAGNVGFVEQVDEAVRSVLENETTMVIHKLRIVPTIASRG